MQEVKSDSSSSRLLEAELTRYELAEKAAQSAAAAAKIQASYRAHREAGALRSLHAAHVAQLRVLESQAVLQQSEAQQRLEELEHRAEWDKSMREEAKLFKETEGEAQRTAAASYIQKRVRAYQGENAMAALHEAHAAELARTQAEAGRQVQAELDMHAVTAQGSSAASRIQARYRARRESSALRSLHAVHVQKLREAQAESARLLEEQASRYQVAETAARGAAGKIQSRYRAHRGATALRSLVRYPCIRTVTASPVYCTSACRCG